MRTKNNLTPKEKKENMGITLGRLKSAVTYDYPKERQLALIEKLYKDYDRLFFLVTGIDQKDL